MMRYIEKNPIVKSKLCSVPESWEDIQAKINDLPDPYKRKAFEIALMTWNLASVGIDTVIEKKEKLQN